MSIGNNSSRVPKASIVRGAPVVVTTDDEFISFYDPLQFIVKDGGKVRYLKFGPGSPFSSSLVSGVGTATGTINSALVNKADIVAIELPDVPNLTDIELFSSTKYYDPVTKVEKAKLVIKVTNTSKDKINIEGVDARIYNPSEKL
jgi:hypothetical protein